jgi:putative ATPase
MEPPGFYAPVPRGLEIKIGQKLDELRARNSAAAPPPAQD